MKRGLVLTLFALQLLACGARPASTSLTRAGDKRMESGQYGQAYANYRAALYNEIEPHADGAKPIVKRMIVAFQHWIDEQIDVARSEIEAGDALAAHQRLSLLLEPRLSSNAWEGQTFRRVMKVQASESQREMIRSLLEAQAEHQWSRVEELQRARHYARALLLATKLTASLRSGHRLLAKKEQLRQEGAAWHDAAALRARKWHGKVVHQAIAARLRGKLTRLPAVDMNWKIEGSAASCESLYESVRTKFRQGANPAVIAFDSDTCQISKKSWTANEPYTYTEWVTREVTKGVSKGQCTTSGGAYQTKYHCTNVNGVQQCGHVAWTTPTYETCTSDQVQKERRRVADVHTAHRDVTHEQRTLRWTGTAVITWPDGSERVAFTIDEEIEDIAYSTPHGTKSISLSDTALVARAADEMFRKLAPQERKVRGASALRLARAAEDAQQRGDDQGADDFHLASLVVAGSPGSLAYLERAYGLDRELWTNIRDGIADSNSDEIEQARLASQILPSIPDVATADQKSCGSCYLYLDRGGQGAMPPRRRDERVSKRDAITALSYVRPENVVMSDLGNQLLVSHTMRTRPTGSLEWAWAASLELGATLGGSYVFSADFMPVGVAIKFGRLHYGLAAGAGFGGVQGGEIPFSFRLPVDAYSMIALSKRFTLTGSARISYLADPARKDGASTDTGGDEFEVSVGLRLEGLMDAGWRSTGYIGGMYREIMGTHFTGAVLGFGY